MVWYILVKRAFCAWSNRYRRDGVLQDCVGEWFWGIISSSSPLHLHLHLLWKCDRQDAMMYRGKRELCLRHVSKGINALTHVPERLTSVQRWTKGPSRGERVAGTARAGTANEVNRNTVIVWKNIIMDELKNCLWRKEKCSAEGLSDWRFREELVDRYTLWQRELL
jgi:hypothetical protein